MTFRSQGRVNRAPKVCIAPSKCAQQDKYQIVARLSRTVSSCFGVPQARLWAEFVRHAYYSAVKLVSVFKLVCFQLVRALLIHSA
jgi:hypothetical protein